MDRDISNWGWGQILELPDHLFGRRFSIGCSGVLAAAGTVFDLSELGLPERCVIWELNTRYVADIPGFGNCSLALGDQLPTTDAQFNAMEQLFPDIGTRVDERRDFSISCGAQSALRGLKVGVNAGGRRLVLRYNTFFAAISKMECEIVVSSAPRSLPEWFV